MRQLSPRIARDLLPDRSARGFAPVLVSRRIAAIAIAFLAALSWSSVAAAAAISVEGPALTGTHTYTIVLSFTTEERVATFATSVKTTGTYTGVFTETIPYGFGSLHGPHFQGFGLDPGVAGSWAGFSGEPQPGGTFTIGTVEITLGPGDTVEPFFTKAEGVVAYPGYVVYVPTTFSQPLHAPEPGTAALLGLGLLGLGYRGRRS
jgi:hypothetical protein